MTIDEFNKTRWGHGMKMKYNGEVYDIISCDFKEALIGFSYGNDPENLSWARCENVELVT